nr:hypothetical protein [Clostridioides sp.]
MYEGLYPDPLQLEKSIYTIGNSVESEERINRYYQWLIDNIPKTELSPDQIAHIRNILQSIQEDRINHNNIFTNIYYQLSGNPVVIVEKEFAEPKNFKTEIENELFRTLESIKRNRTIMFGIPSLQYRDLIFTIISDEIRHASFYNYIFANLYNLM